VPGSPEVSTFGAAKLQKGTNKHKITKKKASTFPQKSHKGGQHCTRERLLLMPRRGQRRAISESAGCRGQVEALSMRRGVWISQEKGGKKQKKKTPEPGVFFKKIKKRKLIKGIGKAACGERS